MPESKVQSLRNSTIHQKNPSLDRRFRLFPIAKYVSARQPRAVRRDFRGRDAPAKPYSLDCSDVCVCAERCRGATRRTFFSHRRQTRAASQFLTPWNRCIVYSTFQYTGRRLSAQTNSQTVALRPTEISITASTTDQSSTCNEAKMWPALVVGQLQYTTA